MIKSRRIPIIVLSLVVPTLVGASMAVSPTETNTLADNYEDWRTEFRFSSYFRDVIQPGWPDPKYQVGDYEPLEYLGMESYQSYEYERTYNSTVINAKGAAYLGGGREPMVDAVARKTGNNEYLHGSSISIRAIVPFDLYPYLYIRGQEIKLRMKYRTWFERSGSYESTGYVWVAVNDPTQPPWHKGSILAEVIFSEHGNTGRGQIAQWTAVGWENRHGGEYPYQDDMYTYHYPRGNEHTGELSFTVDTSLFPELHPSDGSKYYPLYMVVYVRVKAGTDEYNSQALTRGIVDPYIYVDPEDPLAGEVFVTTPEWGLSGPWTYHIETPIDLDRDGYLENVDCDDFDSSVNPGALELLDGIDNDCDGLSDNLYDFVDLGTLGGDYAVADDINNLGQVVGTSVTETGLSRAYLWTANDGMVDLGSIYKFSSGLGINDLGQVIGNTHEGEPYHSFIWTADSGMLDLGALSSNQMATNRAWDINNSGLVVGGASNITAEISAYLTKPEDTDGNGIPDLWNRDENGDGINDLIIDLGVLGTGACTAYGINILGQVVGTCGLGVGVSHSFLITPLDVNGDGEPDTWNLDENGDGANDLMVDLGVLNLSGNRTRARRINDLGQIVGRSWSAERIDRAFLITPLDVNGDGEPDTWNLDENGDGANDLMVDLGTIAVGADPGSRATDALTINDLGQIVGQDYEYPPTGESSRAFLITPEDTDGDGIPDLWNSDIDNDGANDLMIELETDNEQAFYSPRSINDRGQVVGSRVLGNDFDAILWQGPIFTPAGISVVSKPIDPESLSSPVTLTFDEVNKSGYTYLTIGDDANPPPSGFRLGDPPTYYELTSTTTYSGLINVCIDYSGISYTGNEEDLRLHHNEGGEWIDVTSLPVDTANHMICSDVETLSPFAIFEPVSQGPENEPPVGDPGGPYVDETCQPITVDGSGSHDPNGDSMTFEWHFREENKVGRTVEFLAPCTLGFYPLTLIVDDGRGGTDFASTSVIVEAINQSPISDIGGPYMGAIDTDIAFDGNASSDPDGDPLIYDWDWGDSTNSPDAGSTALHSYSASGIYNVCLSVADSDGLSDSACTYAVVYDPSGGFVTGGGWLESPEGAYAPDPSLTGRATFGFVSKYKKGSEVPTGNTEFQFRTADLNFHSDSYDWLVVTGSDYAMFKGVGTINGTGEYLFRIWAGDAEPDTFRIKIWREDELGIETVVYDNGMDQVIGGGSIVIHTKNK